MFPDGHLLDRITLLRLWLGQVADHPEREGSIGGDVTACFDRLVPVDWQDEGIYLCRV